MRGLPVGEQVGGFCRQVVEAGFPMRRAQVGMYTLHPRYGSHTFLWRPGDGGEGGAADAAAGTVTHVPRERALLESDVYLKSPVHHMRSRGITSLRRRLDAGGAEGGAADEFELFAQLRADGLVDYAAHIVPYDPAEAEALAKEVAAAGVDAATGGGPRREFDGIFFSCATDAPGGFDDGQLDQVVGVLPYLALAAKSRLTYDVASTVLETYLGRDAGQRVLTGAIARGSAEAIRAVIWFADLRGFTRLTDTLPRDELVATLDAYLEAMAAPVEVHGGQILKFMGDGLLASFELKGGDDQAVCRAALAAAAELGAAFPGFNAERQAAGKPVMDFGLALHLGEVFYGNIGASERLDFTVIGPTVNEASRIQALCRSLERNVLVSHTFRAAAGAPAELASLGRHELRGVREAQELFGLAR